MMLTVIVASLSHDPETLLPVFRYRFSEKTTRQQDAKAKDDLTQSHSALGLPHANNAEAQAGLMTLILTECSRFQRFWLRLAP
jgi:hypothetical protein